MHFEILSILSVASLASAQLPVSTQQYPSPLVNGSAVIHDSTSDGPLDGPKVSTWTSSAYDWWYFDVVSTDAHNKASIVIQPVNGNPVGGAEQPFVNQVTISGNFKNGTTFLLGQEFTDAVTIKTLGHSSSGKFGDVSWTGSADMSTYVLTVNSTEMNAFGEVVFHSVTPAHYYHDIGAAQNISQLIVDGFGWSNAVPNAKATVKMTINGTQLQFTGAGYHDKNWGSVPMPAVAKTWYWGHASLGKYSLVWFSLLARDGTTKNSAYLSENGNIISVGDIDVRPFGPGTVYPPVNDVDQPLGFNITVDAGFNGVWKFDAVAELESGQLPIEFYSRWIGSVCGGMVGGKKISGTGLWEWMHFIDV